MIFLDCFTRQSARRNLVSKPNRFVTNTPNECQLKCQENSECQYFMLMKTDCYLKRATAINGIKPNKDAIWGPKYCKGA